jgi:hypothetical protein
VTGATARRHGCLDSEAVSGRVTQQTKLIASTSGNKPGPVAFMCLALVMTDAQSALAPAGV